MPELEAARRQWEPKGVGFLALSLEPDRTQVAAMATKLGLAGTVAVTTDEVLAPLGARGIPATALVDARGRLVGVATGERDRAFFSERAQALLAGAR